MPPAVPFTHEGSNSHPCCRPCCAVPAIGRTCSLPAASSRQLERRERWRGGSGDWATVGTLASTEGATLFRVLSPPGSGHASRTLQGRGRGRRLLGGFWRVGQIDVSPNTPLPSLAGLVSASDDGWFDVPGHARDAVVPCRTLQPAARNSNWRHFLQTRRARRPNFEFEGATPRPCQACLGTT